MLTDLDLEIRAGSIRFIIKHLRGVLLRYPSLAELRLHSQASKI